MRLLSAVATAGLVISNCLVAAEPAANPFDGKSLAAWTTQEGKPVSDGWEVADGVIHLKKDGRRAGHIVTAQEFGDFDLSFEWKIAPGGNSGLKYKVRNYGNKVLGCEYQIYDDAGAKKKVHPKNSAGALYDLYEPNDAKQLKPAGEYNHARIVVRGKQIEHWLNGALIVSATIGDDEWNRRVAASKFNDVEGFARNPRGKLMLTDHGSEVWFRNFAFHPAAEVTQATHVFKQVGELAIRADVFAAASDRPRPVVVWIHGGALIMGHRESVPGWLKDALLPRGYAIVSIDYRLAPETQLPELIGDVEDALKWVGQRGPELFQADPARVAVIGGSAGGYLTLVSGFRAQPRPAALVSLWGYGEVVGPWYSQPSPHARHHNSKLSREDAYKQVSGSPISDARDRQGDGGAFYQYCRQNGTWPQAVSGWDPRAEVEKFVPYMPERNVTSQYPPTLLIHGEADTDVPYECSVKMAEQLRQHGVEHRLISFPGAEHGLAGADKKAVDEAYRAAVAFLVRHLERN